MKKYILAMTMGIQKHFTYPMRFGIWILVDLCRMTIMPFLWLGIYGARENVAGFSRADIVTYYLIMMLISFFAISHSSSYIFEEISKGKLSMFLVKPYSCLVYHFMSESGYKIVSGGLGTILFILLSFVTPAYVTIPESLFTIFFFIFFLCLARFLSFCLEALVGLTTFWFGQMGAVNHFRYLFEEVFGGALAPLIFFPFIIREIAGWLPFQYLYYVPIEVFLGHFSASELALHMVGGLVWAGIFFFLLRTLWIRGLKRYDGAGI